MSKIPSATLCLQSNITKALCFFPFHQHGGSFLRRPLSLCPSLPSLGKKLWHSASYLLMLTPAKILFWPKPGGQAALGSCPAYIPAASAFLMTLLIQGISAFSNTELTLQHFVVVSGLSCFTSCPLLCLFFEDRCSSSCSSLQTAAAPDDPFLQRAS